MNYSWFLILKKFWYDFAQIIRNSMQFQNSISYLIHFRFCYSHFDISLHNYLVIGSYQKKYHKVTKWCNALLASSFQHKARHKYSTIECKELQVTVCHLKSGSLFLKKICVSWSFKFSI